MSVSRAQGWTDLGDDPYHRAHTKYYVKFSVSNGGVAIYITNLVHLWQATRTTRQELCEDAVYKGCAIDPSEDEEQYQVFISKLEQSLRGAKGTATEMYRRTGPVGKTPFEVTTSIPLPDPLGELEWTFTFIPRPRILFVSELLGTSLKCNSNAKKREEDLRRVIKEKDHALSRLMEKIETSEIDLAMVFPGFAGTRKRLTAKQATRVVPGLEAFQEDQWDERFRTAEETKLSSIIRDVKEDTTRGFPWDSTTETGDDSSTRSEKRNKKSSTQRGRMIVSRSPSKSISPEPSKRRAPISNRDPSPELLSKADADLETESGTPTPSPSPHPKKQKRGIGVISGQKAKVVSPSKPQPSSPMASGGALPQRSSERSDIEHVSPQTASRPKPKIGAIGGKKVAKSPSPQVSSMSNEAGRRRSITSETISPSPQRELEDMARQKREVEMAERGAEVVRNENRVEPEIEMTETEKADQNRQRLNDALASGRGGKKKRKF